MRAPSKTCWISSISRATTWCIILWIRVLTSTGKVSGSSNVLRLVLVHYKGNRRGDRSCETSNFTQLKSQGSISCHLAAQISALFSCRPGGQDCTACVH